MYYDKCCDRCQRFGGLTKRGEMPQQCILFLGSFEAWEIDYVGPISHEGYPYRYIIVSVDYMTKWAKGRAVKVADAKSTIKFWKEVIFH